MANKNKEETKLTKNNPYKKLANELATEVVGLKADNAVIEEQLTTTQEQLTTTQEQLTATQEHMVAYSKRMDEAELIALEIMQMVEEDNQLDAKTADEIVAKVAKTKRGENKYDRAERAGVLRPLMKEADGHIKWVVNEAFASMVYFDPKQYKLHLKVGDMHNRVQLKRAIENYIKEV